MPEPPPAEAGELARSLGLSLTAAHLLMTRGLTEPTQAEAFLNPSPKLLRRPDTLPDIAIATQRVIKALDDKETICIHGDYDVDGITATALLVTCLTRLGARVRYYLPHRETEGYGLAPNSVRFCREIRAGLLITVDCGSTDHEVVTAARDAGIDVIITDHHECPPTLPQALAVINPKRSDSVYPFRELAGVGVAFKLAWSILSALGRERKELTDLLDLVGLGTIADLVPLLDENRILARLGLSAIRNTSRPGLRKLITNTITDGRTLNEYDVGFLLGPRLNAAGRVDHAENAARLLLTDDESEAERLAARLEDNNTARRRLEKEILRAAVACIEDTGIQNHRVLVVAGNDWPAGVLGLVASQLTRQYGRPAVVIGLTNTTGKGSGRSVPGFDLYTSFIACAEHLQRFGGHQQAGGLTISADRLGTFTLAINEHAAAFPEDIFLPSHAIDVVVPPDELDPDLIRFIGRLEPFGNGNHRPLFAGLGLEVAGRPRIVGQDKKHLKFRVRSGNNTIPAIAWNRAANLPGLEPDRPAALDICFTIDYKPKNGYEPGLIVEDLRTHLPDRAI